MNCKSKRPVTSWCLIWCKDYTHVQRASKKPFLRAIAAEEHASQVVKLATGPPARLHHVAIEEVWASATLFSKPNTRSMKEISWVWTRTGWQAAAQAGAPWTCFHGGVNIKSRPLPSPSSNKIWWCTEPVTWKPIWYHYQTDSIILGCSSMSPFLPT